MIIKRVKSRSSPPPSFSRKTRPHNRGAPASSCLPSQSSCLEISAKRPVGPCDCENSLKTNTRTSPRPCSTWPSAQSAASPSYQLARPQKFGQHLALSLSLHSLPTHIRQHVSRTWWRPRWWPWRYERCLTPQLWRLAIRHRQRARG